MFRFQCFPCLTRGDLSRSRSLKTNERPLQFFLDYAWAPESWPVESLLAWREGFAGQQFGPARSEEIAELLGWGHEETLVVLRGLVERTPDVVLGMEFFLRSDRDALARDPALGEHGVHLEHLLRPGPADRRRDPGGRQPAVIGDATRFSIRTCEPASDFRFTVTLDSVIVVDGCLEQDEFDIESWVYAVGDESYWLLHNDGSFFPREELPELHSQTIFTLQATQDSQLEVVTNVYGGANGTYSGWSRETVFSFPFDFDTNPHHFSHISTGTNDSYDNCTLEVHYTIHRALE